MEGAVYDRVDKTVRHAEEEDGLLQFFTQLQKMVAFIPSIF